MVLADGENRGPAFDFDSFVADCSQTMHCSGTRSKRGWPVSGCTAFSNTDWAISCSQSGSWPSRRSGVMAWA